MTLNIDVKNRKLYCALSSLTKSLLEIVSSSFESDPVLVTESRWEIRDQDTFLKRQIQRPSWQIVLDKNKEKIIATKEFSNFLKVVNADKTISSQLDTQVGTCLILRLIEAIDIPLSLASEFLTDKKIVEFNIPSFNSAYLKLEQYLYSNVIEVEKLTPLCGFTMDSADLLLENNIHIVKLSQDEILEFLRSDINLGISKQNTMFNVQQCAVRTSYELPKIKGTQDIQIEDIGLNKIHKNENEQAVIDALRIYKDGRLYPITTIRRERSIFSIGISHGFENPVKFYIKNEYSLSKNELKEFRSFWKEKNKAKLLDSKSFLTVAIRRFSQSNERDNIEDEIIDLMISAEALFLSSGGESGAELKYRLSHRAAMFIGTDVKQQKYVFDFMQKAYDIRSKIVHGSDPKLPIKIDGSEFSTLEEFCSRIEYYVRFSIKKAIATSNGANKIDWKSVVFPSSS